MVYHHISGRSQRFGFERWFARRSTPSPPGANLRAGDAAAHGGLASELARRLASPWGLPEATLFVNLHASDLLDETLYDPSGALTQWAHRTVLEITERAAIDGIEDISDRIARLRRLGYRIAIDDIGAGYSGLSSFAMVQPDFVKLDITLVRGMDTDPVRTRLVQLLAELCRDLGIFVVAEGVETAAEREALLNLGIDLQQGYLFARPAAPFAEPSSDLTADADHGLEWGIRASPSDPGHHHTARTLTSIAQVRHGLAHDRGRLRAGRDHRASDKLSAIFRSPAYRPPVIASVAVELTQLTRKPTRPSTMWSLVLQTRIH